MFKKSQFIKGLIYTVVIPLLLIGFLFILGGNNYFLISIAISFVACIPFFYRYEQRKPEAREVVVVAIMCALAVLSRLIFAFLPGISPVATIIIITGVAFGKETGFMCGVLSMVISNMFFGQGPWTAYQMIIHGFIGYLAGVFGKHHLMDNIIIRISFAILAGIGFSMIIDLLTTIGSGFTWAKLIALWISALPFTGYYVFSNVLFILLLYKPLMKRLTRVKIKYGLMEEDYHQKLTPEEIKSLS